MWEFAWVEYLQIILDMSSKNMFCKNCGNQVIENAKFCINCGAKISDLSSTDQKMSDNVIQRSQVSQTNVGSINISPTISPVINVETQSAPICPTCGISVTKEKLKECKYCHQKYCSSCEIGSIACPNCGMPYKPLRKIMCGACKQIFAITKADKKIIDDLDNDELYSVKQRCTCPICNRTMYYSGYTGFVDVGEYALSDILNDSNKNIFNFTTLNKFKVGFKVSRPIFSPQSFPS